jgi:hypothetical protein
VEARILQNGSPVLLQSVFIVAELIAYKFEGKLLKRMQNSRIGDPAEERIQMGPEVHADVGWNRSLRTRRRMCDRSGSDPGPLMWA